MIMSNYSLRITNISKNQTTRVIRRWIIVLFRIIISTGDQMKPTIRTTYPIESMPTLTEPPYTMLDKSSITVSPQTIILFKVDEVLS